MVHPSQRQMRVRRQAAAQKPELYLPLMTWILAPSRALRIRYEKGELPGHEQV